MSLKLQLIASHSDGVRLRLPHAYRNAAIREIAIHDESPPKRTSYWSHFSVEDIVEHYRLHVTTEPLPVPPGQRNTKGNRWIRHDEFVRGDFAEYVGRLRYEQTWMLLDKCNRVIDYDLHGLNDAHLSQPVYGEGRFTWLQPDHRMDWRTRAYRDVPKATLVVRDAAAIVNRLLRQGNICAAEALITFFE